MNKFNLKLIEKYIELINYNQFLAKEYEISTKYLEAAIEQIKMLKLELISISVGRAENTFESSSQIGVQRKRK